MTINDYAPSFIKLKWKDCEKDKPKFEDYYIVKYDQKKYNWFLSYFSLELGYWLSVGCDHVWHKREPQPWKWAELPRIKQEKSLFDV